MAILDFMKNRSSLLLFVVLLLAQSYYTTAQVELVKDINPSAPAFEANEKLIVYNGKLLFTANDGVVGNELWVSDGTEAGTTLLKDINPGATNSFPLNLTPTDSRLYFRGFTDNEGWELYYTDGTTSGTVINTDLISGASGSSPANFYAAGNNLFYMAEDPDQSGRELFVTNTSTIANALTSYSNDNASIASGQAAPLGDSLIFIPYSVTVSDPVGYEPYYATPSSTGLVKDINPGSGNSFIIGMQNIGSEIYFFADTTNDIEPSNFDLWKTNGTPEGTIGIKELPENSAGDLLTPVANGSIFFVASASGIGPELWVTDGTEVGTEIVKVINPSNTFTGSEINSITPAGERIFFGARDGSTGKELWVSDGTEAGTYLVKDINIGPSFGLDATINPMLWLDDRLYFAADDGTHGTELWVTDGTEAGTSMVEDINPGSASSDPAQFTVFDGAIYFVATDATHGRELRKYTPAAATTISGTVTDLDAGDPLANVSVQNISQNETTQTDGNGQYTVVAATEDTIVFMINDYVPDSVIVVEGQSVYDVQLEYNPCYDVECEIGKVCIDGTCVDPCTTTECAEDEYCDGGLCLPLDPCEGVECPIGQVCYDGSCYEPIVSGIVKDQQQNPLDSVLVYHIESQDTLYTDVNGTYFTSTSGNYMFYKQGYATNRLYLQQGASNVIMSQNPCEGVFCPFGQICYAGSCYEPVEQIDLSFTVKDIKSDQPLSGIKVSPLNNYTNVTATNSNGIATITIPYPTQIIFRDTTGIYNEIIIDPSDANQTVYLGSSACDGVECPIGQICYEGSCYEPTSTSEVFEGYIFDGDSLPLSNVYVSVGPNQTTTNAYGYFSLQAVNDLDSVYAWVSKNDHINMEQQLFKAELNEIYVYGLDYCQYTQCPIGQVCYEGSCYDPAQDDPNPDLCEGVFCPFGQICYEGSCYEPCEETGPGICSDSLTDACEGVECPIGQICENGVCYDPCAEDNDADNLCYNASIDPCENINPPAGYICQNGVVVPDCPDNNSACQTSSICNVVACPPGDICFTCFDQSGINSSGTSLISGQLNLSGINSGGRSLEANNENLFIYLIEIESGKKTAIAKSDASGEFEMLNVPTGSYYVFLTASGYFMEDMILEVGTYENISMTFTSSNRFVNMEVGRVTSVSSSIEGAKGSWYPVPNTTATFYLNESDNLKRIELYNAQGTQIDLNYTVDNLGARKRLSLNEALNAGVYLLKWQTEASSDYSTQRIILK
ncbi:MAG: ELWxxDGT repeat protein [Fulvivirga sp.]